MLSRFADNLRYYSRKFSSYNLFTYASSASFFIITALLPLTMLTLSIVSFTPLAEQDFLDMISSVIPESFVAIFDRIISDINRSGVTALSVSLITLLWSASKSVLGLMDGLNAIANVADFRNYFLKRAVCILYMLLLIVGLILTLALRVFGEQILSQLQVFAPYVAIGFEIILNFRGLTLYAMVSGIILIIYTAFPNKKMRVHLQLPGALFSAFAWLAFSELYSIYVENYSSFSMVYGSIGVVILAMIWLYFCISIVFIGAVINQLYPSIFWRAYIGLKYRRLYRRQLQQEKRELRRQRSQLHADKKAGRKHDAVPVQPDCPDQTNDVEENESPQ